MSQDNPRPVRSLSRPLPCVLHPQHTKKWGKTPGVLKDQVCSPGGTTIAAVEALEQNGFRAAAMSAVVAATTRSIEMRDGSKQK